MELSPGGLEIAKLVGLKQITGSGMGKGCLYAGDSARRARRSQLARVQGLQAHWLRVPGGTPRSITVAVWVVYLFVCIPNRAHHGKSRMSVSVGLPSFHGSDVPSVLEVAWSSLFGDDT